MRALDAQLIEHRHRVPDPEWHCVRVRVVGLVAPPEAPVVDVDQVELVGGKRLRDPRLPHFIDRVEKPSMEDDRGSFATVVLEVDWGSI